jgi:hypothetical protein
VFHWDALVAASQVNLPGTRSSQNTVREMIAQDRLLLSKLVFIREFTRKALVHIEYFENAGPLAHDVYTRLVAIQSDLNPLFSVNEITAILEMGRCPEELRVSMASLIRIASNAARNEWIKKMEHNQDSETIEVYKMMTIFNPATKDAFPMTAAKILEVLRPVHDAIYGPVDVDYDVLKVILIHSFPILQFKLEGRLISRSTCQQNTILY